MSVKSLCRLREGGAEHRESADFDADAVLGARDDLVVDLRINGRTESYLRHHKPMSVRAGRRLRAVRRTLDVVTALVVLVLVTPILAGVALIVALTSDGPIFFAQERVGRDGKIFRCLKFRSMYPDADDRLTDLIERDAAFRNEWFLDHKVVNDPRVTPLGQVLRKTSLDELPQLVNVLKGDMSIIGPRPVIPGETVRYGDVLPAVLSVRPGMTGLWQVSGRNEVAYEERVSLDLQYVDRQSLRLDAQILAKTVSSVARGQGAS